MLSWRFKRKFAYGFSTFLVLVICIGVPVFLLTYRAPSCFDGILNGTETGVDCGGSCVKLCTDELVAPNVLWTRVIEVVPGVYNTISRVENPNGNAIGRGSVYTVKLFDASGRVIAERAEGFTVPTMNDFPIFVSGFNTQGSVPTRAILEFNQQPVWERLPLDTVYPLLNVSKEQLSIVRGAPRLTATLTNAGTVPLTDFVVVAELFDRNGNIVNASQTYVDELATLTQREVTFTWAQDFGINRVARIVITPVVVVGR